MSDELYELRSNGMSEESAKAFTRAVPDVPEMVRYRMDVDIDILHPIVEPDGKYVLYSEAAAIIAAKDGMQQQWQDIAKHHTGYENPSMAFRVLLERAEAAEAKLAYRVNQEPVAWLCERLDFSYSGMFSKVVRNPESIAQLKDMGATITSLYAAPIASDADLKALEGIVKAWEATKSGDTSVKEIQRWLIEDMKPAIDACRAALNESEQKK